MLTKHIKMSCPAEHRYIINFDLNGQSASIIYSKLVHSYLTFNWWKAPIKLFALRIQNEKKDSCSPIFYSSVVWWLCVNGLESHSVINHFLVYQSVNHWIFYKFPGRALFPHHFRQQWSLVILFKGTLSIRVSSDSRQFSLGFLKGKFFYKLSPRKLLKNRKL